MSREHKYKLWDKEENKMYQCVTIACDNKNKWTPLIYTSDHIINGIDHDNYELLEYIGLYYRIVRKDGSKPKEIYRCDIIKALNRNYDCEDNKENYFQLFEVTYLNGCYMFGDWNAHEFFNKFMYIEDLGSKFENPELLEK